MNAQKSRCLPIQLIRKTLSFSLLSLPLSLPPAERYLVVCYPLKALYLSTRYKAFVSILIVSICSLLFNVTRFAEITVVYNEQTGIYQIGKSDLRENKFYYMFYYIFLNLLFLYG